MKYLAIIQARCGSSRLPGKVLKDICGKPMLLRMIERVKKSKYIDELVIATTIEKDDLPIVALCAQNNVSVFVGSENDVLDRYYQAAKLFQPEYVIRLTADCPCIDPKIIDEAIESMEDSSDYLSMLSETFPDGLDMEIFRFQVLKKVWREAKLQSEREHVTQFIVKNNTVFNLQDFVSQCGNYGHERWTVDEPEDFELVTHIFNNFFDGSIVADFSYEDILQFLDSNPELRKLNAHIARNEGLAKSLREDCVVEIDE